MLKNYRKFWWIFLLASFITAGCSSGFPSRAQRLARFEKILPPDIRAAFNTGDYEKSIKMISREYQTNQAFRQSLEQVKDAEAINIFTIREVVEFFRDYFVNYGKSK